MHPSSVSPFNPVASISWGLEMRSLRFCQPKVLRARKITHLISLPERYAMHSSTKKLGVWKLLGIILLGESVMGSPQDLNGNANWRNAPGMHRRGDLFQPMQRTTWPFSSGAYSFLCRERERRGERQR